jgi:hypothetical protein
MLDASYTWSSSRDQDSNERAIGTGQHLPEDQYNLDAEWGPSSFDIRHKLVASAAVELPFDLLLSAMVTVRSGFPYSAWHNGDLNGDQVDDRAVVEIEPGVYYHYPRHSERQPWFHNTNIRLSKTLRLGKEIEAELLGEVFNLFDNDNLWVGSWRQTLSEGCDSTGDGGWLPCTVIDDFGTAEIPGQPRRYQLGLKLRF